MTEKAWLIEHRDGALWWSNGRWTQDRSTAMHFLSESVAEIGLEGFKQASPTIFRSATVKHVSWEPHPNLPGRSLIQE